MGDPALKLTFMPMTTSWPMVALVEDALSNLGGQAGWAELYSECQRLHEERCGYLPPLQPWLVMDALLERRTLVRRDGQRFIFIA